MLFLKYIFDIWQDRLDTLKTQFSDYTERLQRWLNQERFILPDGSDYYSLYEQHQVDNIGECIDIALNDIGQNFSVSRFGK